MTAVLVILPALNEAASIAKTVTRIRQQVPQADILVINDGSKDNTAEVARAAGALVLSLPCNVGIGAAVQTAFKFAMQYQYEVVIRNDGDGQHDPTYISRLMQTLCDEQLDVVIGSRFLQDGDYGTPPLRRLGIGVICVVLRRITGWHITDPTSGFNAYNQRAIRLFSQHYPHDYPEPEAIMLMHRSGLKMREVPVQMLPREHGTSSITPIRSAFYMFNVLLAILITLLRRTPAVEAT
jgi:hypothetical protein